MANNGLTDTFKLVDLPKISKPTALSTMVDFTAVRITNKIVLGNGVHDFLEQDVMEYYKNFNLVDLINS